MRGTHSDVGCSWKRQCNRSLGALRKVPPTHQGQRTSIFDCILLYAPPSTQLSTQCHLFLCQVAPPGMNQVQTMACGACSVEHALKGAFMAYRVRKFIHKLHYKLATRAPYTSHRFFLIAFGNAIPAMIIHLGGVEPFGCLIGTS